MNLNPNEEAYLRALRFTKQNGSRRKTRNGITDAVFARQMRFNLQHSFPATTTKYLAFNVVVAELIWFLEAGKATDWRLSIARLNELLEKPATAKNIWTMDQTRFASQGKAKFEGDCGRIYGAQWRNWRAPDGSTVDQIAKVMKQIKEDPFSRYHIVTAWNPGELNDMCLPPCHMKMQFFVRPSRRRDKKMYLDISMDQRSCDMFLGVPFNIASYALLCHMVAQCVDMVPGELVITLEDCHIYMAGLDVEEKPQWNKGHIRQVNKQLARKPLKGPKLWLNPLVKNIDDFTVDDIKLIGYRSHEKISAVLL
jgi:thymidylate synthase